MTLRNALLLTIWSAVVAIATIFTSGLIERYYMSQKIHTLEHPLMLEGSAEAGHNYLLPIGTTLYFDQAFPEGFIRYRVYLNVEGVDLESSTLADPSEIRPTSAYPVDGASLAKLLREYPLTKAELASILSSSQLSQNDIREVLAEYDR
ncbi:hypothetical protein [Lysobacter sp. F6437]|uniref:hypothetical protein n=1 Tax=Lysobacter sp. F6437 TaxID=3459296 RepID=UPI00403D8300